LLRGPDAGYRRTAPVELAVEDWPRQRVNLGERNPTAAVAEYGPLALSMQWEVSARISDMADPTAVGPYEFAGRDLGTFVSSWLRKVQSDDAPSRLLLEHVDEGYDYGAHFLMANIAPQATDPAAGDETLLFYAVMATYQNDGFPQAGIWQGEESHLRRAFAHAATSALLELPPTCFST
jgi:hypothetical protein